MPSAPNEKLSSERSLPTVWGDVCEADRGDGVSTCHDAKSDGRSLRVVRRASFYG